jgi:hypothetical protein
MVFGIIGMVNFAHGDVFMLSAFIALIILSEGRGFDSHRAHQKFLRYIKLLVGDSLANRPLYGWPFCWLATPLATFELLPGRLARSIRTPLRRGDGALGASRGEGRAAAQCAGWRGDKAGEASRSTASAFPPRAPGIPIDYLAQAGRETAPLISPPRFPSESRTPFDLDIVICSRREVANHKRMGG